MRTALVISLLAVATLTGCTPPGGAPTPTDTATTEPAPVTVGSCADGTIAPTVNDAEGSAGHLNYQIAFTNTGPDTCTLEGYPQIAVIGMGNGTQLGDVAANMPDLPLEVVTIASGESAYARLQAVTIDPGGGPLGTDCGLGFGDGFNIYIPGAVEPTFVPYPGVAACTSGIVWMDIAPISAT